MDAESEVYLTAIEARCQRRVIENLLAIGRQIGPRTRMVQIISTKGVVDGLRGVVREETSGWNDLYIAGLLGLSVEATVVESLEFVTFLRKPNFLEWKLTFAPPVTSRRNLGRARYLIEASAERVPTK